MEKGRNSGNIPNHKRLALLMPTFENALIYNAKLTSGRNSLQERINTDNKQLRSIIGVLPKVEFIVEQNPDIKEKEMFRVVLGNNEEVAIDYAKRINSSHTVVALHDDSIGNVISQCGSESCDCIMKFKNIQGLDIIIRSIALDIQVSRSRKELSDWTTDEKRLFSKAKAEFLGINSCCDYICFAVEHIVYNDDGKYHSFDYKGYLQKWDDFDKWYVSNKSNVVASTGETSLVDKALSIISDHPHKHQIGYRRVVFQLSKLDTGSHILVRIYRRPKGKNRKALSALFGNKKLRVGLFKIVNEKRKSEFERYSHYLHLYYFEFKKE